MVYFIPVIYVMLSHLSCYAGAATNTLDNLLDFFPESQGDGLNIIWAHGVNSPEVLNKSLTDDTMMLETDIILRGIGTENQTNIPVNAHPPATDSDLTVMHFVNATSLTPGKGMKLDFKYLEAVGPTMEIVLELTDQISAPLWINADIVKGPNSPKDPVPPVEFITTANSFFNQTVMSLGFTTDCCLLNNNEDLYTWTMIFDILQYTYSLDPQPVTYPVRAVWCVRSWSKFTWLLGLRDSFSITVWSGSADLVDVQGLISLRSHGDITRIYYDLPDMLRNRFLEAIKEGSPKPDENLPTNWQRDQWKSFSAEGGNFVFLSTESAGISGAAHRAGYLQSLEELTAEQGVTYVNVRGSIQFVDRYDVPSNEAKLEVVLRTNEIDLQNSEIFSEGYSLDGVRLTVGRDGSVLFGAAVDAGGNEMCQLPSAECYSFHIIDRGEDGPMRSTVSVVSCADSVEADENSGRNCSLSIEPNQIPVSGDKSFVVVSKLGGSGDVVIENLALSYSQAEDPGSATGIACTLPILILSLITNYFLGE